VPRLSRATLVLLLPLLCGAGGCATCSHQVQAPIPDLSGRGVILVVDGAGNTGGLSAALRQAVTDQRLPLHVETCEWSYGPYRVLADQTDYCHAREHGGRLAARISAYRQACPDSRVYLVAHSAGSAVALAAAESLPPGSVEEVILLGPAVSSGYDLRPALRCARRGIDVFTSERDLFVLGLGVSVTGTTDRRWTAAAGRVGFTPVVETPEDAALYGKLRQHRWEPCDACAGNYGGHFDTYESRYLYTHVLPLLTDPGSMSAPPP
jgi:pimeloyl-ACP methyl ester carboxylesterase